MRRFREFQVVWKKEIKDAFRDGKSIFAAIVLPLILFPAMFLIMGLGASGMAGKIVNPKIAVVEFNGETETPVEAGSELHRYIEETLLSAAKDESGKARYEIVQTANASQAMADGQISVILKLQSGFRQVMEDPASRETREIRLVYDDRSTFGSESTAMLYSAIGAYQSEIYRMRLEHLAPGTDPSDLQAVLQERVSLKDEYPELARGGAGNPFVQMLLPFLLTFMLAVGGSGIAVDLVAGEKERNTFEALLSTSASRFSILSAKFAMILLFSFLSAIVQSASVLVAMWINPEMFFGGSGFSVPAGALILSFLNLLLLAALFSSILLVVSAGARTYKEASTKASFVNFLPLICVAIMFMDAADIGLGFMFIPILNVASVLKMVLAGQISYLFITVSILVNAALVALAVWYTLRTFKDERLITRG